MRKVKCDFIGENIQRVVKSVLNEMVSEHIIKDFDNREIIARYIEEVWGILQLSYSGVVYGGETPKKLFKNTDLLTIVGDSKISAAAVYRNDLGGNKLFAIGCDQTNTGKENLKAIINRDINDVYGGYWVEASEAIEHLFKKGNGNPIPNIYTKYLIGRDVEMLDDGFHYIRTLGIGNNQRDVTKVIFGFRDIQFYNKVIDEIDNYSEIKDIFNTINENVDGYYPDNVQKALFAINKIDELYDEDIIDMLTPSMKNVLEQSLNILNTTKSDKTINSAIRHCMYLLENLPLIQLHKAV